MIRENQRKMTNGKREIRRVLFSYILVIFGAMVAAFAIEQILVPVQILDGGMVGVSIIVSSITPLPLSILTICFNLPLVWIGSRKLEKSFFVRTLIAMVIFSVSLSLFGEMAFTVTEDKLLATIFGGLLLGFGVGLIIQNGGCLDGTEAVAILISKKTNLSVGQIVLIFNVIIYMLAGLLFGLDRALYSLMTYFIVSRIVDFISTGMLQGKAVMIITDQGDKIAEDIYQTLGRTVTFIKGEGLISGEKTVLYCVITLIEVSTIKSIIEKADYSAFMTISDVSEIVGKHIRDNSKQISANT